MTDGVAKLGHAMYDHDQPKVVQQTGIGYIVINI